MGLVHATPEHPAWIRIVRGWERRTHTFPIVEGDVIMLVDPGEAIKAGQSRTVGETRVKILYGPLFASSEQGDRMMWCVRYTAPDGTRTFAIESDESLLKGTRLAI